MVGHKIFIRANGNMMIHLPQGIAIGNADDMRKMAGALDTVTESMINVYAKRTSKERDAIRVMLAAETWMSPEQAVEHGFADEVRGVVKAAASIGNGKVIFNGATFDLSRFHNTPTFSVATMEIKNMPTETPPAPPAPTPTPEPGKNAPAPGAEPARPAPRMPENEPKPPDPNHDPANDPKEAGARAERARVMALMKLDRPSTHDIVMKAITDGQQPADILDAVVAAMDKGSAQGARRRDAAALNGIPGSTTDIPDGGGTPGFGALIKERVQARISSRRLGGKVVHSRN
jgi:hypothetical protein